MYRRPLAFLVAALSTGCASVDVYPVQNAYGSVGKTLGNDDSGIRFYRPAPHVWITRATPADKVNIATSVQKDTSAANKEKTDTTVVSSATVGYQATLVLLPDYSQEYLDPDPASPGSA